jgi:hypothetical protein
MPVSSHATSSAVQFLTLVQLTILNRLIKNNSAHPYNFDPGNGLKALYSTMYNFN